MSVENRIQLDHPEAHEKLTARIFHKKRNESGYIDAGNVKEYADASSRSLVTRSRSAYGMRHVNDEQADVNHESWTFLLDERDEHNEKLLKMARKLTQHDQAQAEGASASLDDVQLGRWSMIGAYNIANVLVTGALAGVLDEGTDYELDKENGRIKFLEDAGVAEGEDVVVTFDEPAISFEKFESQKEQTYYGDFLVEEYNAYAKVFLRRYSFRGYLNVTEFPNQTGEFGTFRVKLTPAAPVTYMKRPEAETLPSVTETGEGPVASSSSSSLSSSSSAHSSSSSSS